MNATDLPVTLPLLDRHGGFTAVTHADGRTLWRPGRLLADTTGVLVRSNPNGNYQGTPCVQGFYKAPGYRYLVAVWFSKATGQRVA